jgi:hypothetical protein
LPNSEYGQSVAISDEIMLVGAPNALFGTGAILSYLPTADGAWQSSLAQYGAETSSGFGHAIDVDDNAILVGAPLQSDSAGLAFFYEHSNGRFANIGSPMRGGGASSELFGFSVAVSKKKISIVGAPGNNDESKDDRGAFYIFEHDGTDWILQESATGFGAGDRLGEAVDVDTESGSLVAVGAPGTNGFAMIYEKLNGIWTNTFSGIGASDSFGTSIKVLSASSVAIGAPSHSGGRGRIAVYEKLGTRFRQLPDLVGQEGDRLGDSNKLSGSGRSLIVGTQDGRIQRFDFDATSQTWVEIGEETNYGNGMQAIAAPSSLRTVAAGGNSKSSVFKIIR